MIDGGGSSVPGRRLGWTLRELRVAARLSPEDAAAVLKCSPLRVGRIESGFGPVRGPEVRTMCELYGASPEVTAALVGLVKEIGAKGWWCSSGATVPDGFDFYAGLAAMACRLREYQDAVVPPLLQTRGYAAALLAAPPAVPEGERERLVAVRLGRQSVLHRSLPQPPQYEVVLSEAALLTVVGGPAVLAEQLRYLLTAVAELPHVSIRVVPLAVGPHIGAVAGTFVMLEFPVRAWAQAESSVVYRESLTGALYLDRAREFVAYERVWAGLDAVALDEEESRHLIARRSDELHHSAAS